MNEKVNLPATNILHAFFFTTHKVNPRFGLSGSRLPVRGDQTRRLESCRKDSLYSVAVQRPRDVETVAALHGSDSRLHDSGRAQH